MGLFGNIFGSKKSDGKETKRQIPWIPLTEMGQLDEIETSSASRPQLIFKHSTTCGVSRMVLNMFEKNPLLQEDGVDVYFLDLHSYRKISDEIAHKFQVRHQSPQLLVVKANETVAHASHGGITEIDLGDYL